MAAWFFIQKTSQDTVVRSEPQVPEIEYKLKQVDHTVPQTYIQVGARSSDRSPYTAQAYISAA